MKKIIPFVLSISLIAMLTFTAVGAVSGSMKSPQNSVRLTDSSIQKMNGAGGWGKFVNGVACGAGIVGIAAGALSGVGAVVATMAITGVAANCVSAFD